MHNWAILHMLIIKLQICRTNFLLSTSVRDDPLNVFFIIANSHPHIVANLRLGQVMFCGIEVHLLSTVYLVSLTNMLNASMYMFK